MLQLAVLRGALICGWHLNRTQTEAHTCHQPVRFLAVPFVGTAFVCVIFTCLLYAAASWLEADRVAAQLTSRIPHSNQPVASRPDTIVGACGGRQAQRIGRFRRRRRQPELAFWKSHLLAQYVFIIRRRHGEVCR